MVVGEPSLMGGEFGDEDERLITRLENTQYDPSASGVSNGLDDPEEYVSLSGGPGPGSVPSNVNAPPPPWSGPNVPSASNPGSVSSNSDNRGKQYFSMKLLYCHGISILITFTVF